MKRRIETIRWRLADYLSRIACWLRGQEWYVADTWHGVPGNRAAELKQIVWVNAVAQDALSRPLEDQEELKNIERAVAELAQLAGENWGHVWPKGRR